MSENPDEEPGQPGGTASQYVLPEPLARTLIEKAHSATARKGQIIIGHSDDAHDVYYVASGMAQVSLLSQDGKEANLRSIGPGELFGELAALDGNPRSASVVAHTDMTLYKLSAGQFESWLAETSGAGLWLSRLLVGRIREMTERTFELATMHVTRRIQLEILRLAQRGEGSGGTVRIDPFPTHAELAARIGTHREAISREIGWLRKAGILTTEGRTLTLLDMAKLRGLAQD